MGIALFTISTLFAPLQELFTRMVPAHKVPKARSQRQPPLFMDEGHRNTMPTTAARARPARTSTSKDSAKAAGRSLQLRVVRNVEPGCPAGRTGRLVISGRMADVCAELERLATLEAAQDNVIHH